MFPPFITLEVNVTELPSQIELSKSFDVILILTGKFDNTVVEIVLDVSGEPAAQIASEVSITLTTSLLFKLDNE